jgi:hypothetical protein
MIGFEDSRVENRFQGFKDNDFYFYHSNPWPLGLRDPNATVAGNAL